MHRDLGGLHSEHCQDRACDHAKPRRSMRNEKASPTLLHFILPCYIQPYHMRMQEATHEPMLLFPNIVIMY